MGVTTIAICTNVEDLNKGGWTSKEVCKKYPGSGWMPYLKQYAERQGISVYSGYEAYLIKLTGCLVIQEEENEYASRLISELEGIPWVLFCFESPLFTPFFYDKIDEIKKPFLHSFLFSGGTRPVYFPSFDLDDITTPIQWDLRKDTTCTVVSNKHYGQYIKLFKESPAWRESINHQLHDLRYHAIQTLKLTNSLDLYGKGWPEGYGTEIPAGKKCEIIKHYKVCLCFENLCSQGYVTEKIIDCLVSGVIPIYMGAPDIKKYVPTDTFLLTTDEIPGKHTSIEMIKEGQKFLKSENGIKFSYQGFAKAIMDLI